MICNFFISVIWANKNNHWGKDLAENGRLKSLQYLNNGDQMTITAELPASAADEGYVLKETEKINADYGV